MAKCKFFADDGPAATNRIKWYVVPDDTPVYDDWTCFWPRVDVPPDQALPQFEDEGHGRDVRRFYAGNDIYGYDKDHVHGDRDDFLGLSPRSKYFIEGEPDPVQDCPGTGVFARFRFSHQPGLVSAKGRFRFSASILGVGASRNCYYLCLNASLHQYAQGPNIPLLDGATEFSMMLFGRRAAANSPVIMSQAGNHTSRRIEILMWTDGNIYFVVSTATTLNYATYVGCNDNLLHHVAMVFNGTGATDADRLKAYIDGLPVALTFATSIPAAVSTVGATMRLGWQWTNDVYQTGDLDDVTIFPFAASPALVHGIALRTSDPAAHSPTLLVRFEEGEGTIAHDSSGNGYDFTLVNGASFCGTICLPRSAARFRFRGVVRDRIGPADTMPGRFRFRGVVIDATPVIDTFPGRFRFRGVVRSGVDDGGIAVSRFRFRGRVHNVVDPGDPVEGKFRFKATLWGRTIIGSVNAINFVSELGQYQTYSELGSFDASAITIMFWAKRPTTGNGGAVSIQCPDDTYIEVALTGDEEIGMTAKATRVIDDVTLTVEYTGAVPPTHGWHHYAVSFREGDFGETIVCRFFFDGVEQDFVATGTPPGFSFLHFEEDVWIGKSNTFGLSNCLMDDVGIVPGVIDPAVVYGIANATVDSADAATWMLFRYEEDDDTGQAWETNRADWFPAFVNDPAHVTDVPPLLAD